MEKGLKSLKKGISSDKDISIAWTGILPGTLLTFIANTQVLTRIGECWIAPRLFNLLLPLVNRPADVAIAAASLCSMTALLINGYTFG